MDGDYVERIIRLMVEGERLPEGPHQIATFEEAVRLADSQNDLTLGFRTRRRLMSAAMCGGQPDLLMVAFAWCLAQSDRDPHHFPPADLLWAYRWVICELTSFPQVQRSRFDELLAEMEKRYRAFGSTLRGYWLLRNRMESRMGNIAAAVQAYDRFQTCPRDVLSDSPEVEQAFKALHLLPLGDDYRTVDACTPILRNVYKSELYQGIAQAIVLAPLVRLGRHSEACAYHVRGYQFVSRNPRYVDRVGDHITFLAVTDNLGKAYTLLAKHLPDALTTVDLSARFEFFLGCRFLFEIVREQRRTSIKLRLTERFPAHQPGGDYSVAELIRWFDDQLADLAIAFDRRNGNDYFRRQVYGLERLKSHFKRFPLPSRGED
jgi:hypothetical protein